MQKYILALDQGTTSSRAIVFDAQARIVSSAQREFRQILPAPGIVEHDPQEIWQSQFQTAQEALAQGKLSGDQIAAIGLTNQRETTVLWERQTGRPVDHAVVWQSRISAGICERLKQEGMEPLFRDKTGLLLDPYFSGTKVRHLLDKHSGLRSRAERGEILFGTVDSYLIWRLTEGRVHATDPSNASRTLMYNLHTQDWDDELLRALQVPRAMLPEIRPSSGVLGETRLLGTPIPIAGCAGDQQAALFGQTCFDPGSAKNTYGTGCFLLMNTGDRPAPSQSQLLTTVAWSLDNKITYGLEGSVFVAGAAIQWLRDGLGVIRTLADLETLIREVRDTEGVYFVPAFVGLGAPHWDPYARGTIVGLSRQTTAAHVALAAMEAMAFQTRDVLDAMQQDAGLPLPSLKVDGGASVNDRLMQFQSDILSVPVQRPVVSETTALGAAYLAGLAVGYWPGLDELRRLWQLGHQYTPAMADAERHQRYARWQEAVRRARDWDRPPRESA